MKKYTLFSFLIALIMFAVSCGTSDGMMPRQTGDAASEVEEGLYLCLLYTSPSPRDRG